MVLGCEKWSGRSDRWIADQVGVNDHTVAKIRCVISAPDQARTGKDGKTYQVGVSHHTVEKLRTSGGQNAHVERTGKDGKTYPVADKQHHASAKELAQHQPAVTDYANAADSVIDKKDSLSPMDSRPNGVFFRSQRCHRPNRPPPPKEVPALGQVQDSCTGASRKSAGCLGAQGGDRSNPHNAGWVGVSTARRVLKLKHPLVALMPIY